MVTVEPASVVTSPRFNVTIDFGDGSRTIIARLRRHQYAKRGFYTAKVSVKSSDRPDPTLRPNLLPIQKYPVFHSPPRPRRLRQSVRSHLLRASLIDIRVSNTVLSLVMDLKPNGRTRPKLRMRILQPAGIKPTSILAYRVIALSRWAAVTDYRFKSHSSNRFGRPDAVHKGLRSVCIHCERPPRAHLTYLFSLVMARNQAVASIRQRLTHTYCPHIPAYVEVVGPW